MPARAEPLPFFVYGTLRAGQRHYAWTLRGRTTREEPALLAGAMLYEGPGFPYAVAVPDGGHAMSPARGARATITGELMYVPEPAFGEVLATLDRLEGPDYDRLVVRLLNGTRAWTYLAAEPLATRLRTTGTPIPGGDWLARED
ncbi:gamma-glutamylcyclotransferase family protein [Streptomyces xiamenensis]